MACCHQEIELSDEQAIDILEKADRLTQWGGDMHGTGGQDHTAPGVVVGQVLQHVGFWWFGHGPLGKGRCDPRQKSRRRERQLNITVIMGHQVR